jgi:MarR family transcriptional regulator, temperature-dependent positive regulator of motility
MSLPPPPGDNNLHYELLRQIAEQQAAPDGPTSQRALAQRLGVSVGKINYCLRAVVDKGWVKVANFRRADNKWAYTYLLTPSGVRAKVRLTRDFLGRKEREFEQLQVELALLRAEIDRHIQEDPTP